MKTKRFYKILKSTPAPLGAEVIDVKAGLVGVVAFGVAGLILGWLILFPLLLAHFQFVPVPSVSLLHPQNWYAGLKPAVAASFDLQAELTVGLTLLCAYIGGVVGFKPKKTEEHLSGRRPLAGAAASKQMATAIVGKPDGIYLHPSLQLSLDQESKHFMFVGAPGGGKTQTLHYIIPQLISRGDKVFLYDNKGDFTGKYKKNFSLIAPWDARSYAWDIAADVCNDESARAFAGRFIEQTDEPIWSDGARIILVAILIKLQKEKGKNWGFPELHTTCVETLIEKDALIECVKTYNPSGAGILQAELTLASFISNLATQIVLFEQLSKAWKDTPASKKISMVAWLHDDNHKNKRLIFQGNGKYARLSEALTGSILALLSAEAQSQTFTDSRTRKLWFLLDEAPTLGKVDLISLVSLGRSKGIRVLAAFQDVSQIVEIYGQNVSKTWTSCAGTMLVFRVNAGETSQWLAEKMIGKRLVEREKVTITQTKDGTSRAKTTEEVDRFIFHPSELQTHLGPCDAGVRALVLGFGDVVGQLTWPYVDATPQYPIHTPAPWLKTQSHAEKEEQDNKHAAAQQAWLEKAAAGIVEEDVHVQHKQPLSAEPEPDWMNVIKKEEK